ncbi:UNVERIFIED_CONTAM: hypothetical protein Sangu_2967700 [Sesamum angustifolium]|uniref:Uncharacterized protein n=1 Tax=Sesamum angustifolium TaxID=2727405 RepID=A0AAW2IJ63_9LAMI
MVGDFFGIDPRAASHAIGRGELRIDSEASARSKSRSLRVPNTTYKTDAGARSKAPGPSAIYVREELKERGS